MATETTAVSETTTHPWDWESWYVISEGGDDYCAFPNWDQATSEYDKIANAEPGKDWRIRRTKTMPSFVEEMRDEYLERANVL